MDKTGSHPPPKRTCETRVWISFRWRGVRNDTERILLVISHFQFHRSPFPLNKSGSITITYGWVYVWCVSEGEFLQFPINSDALSVLLFLEGKEIRSRQNQAGPSSPSSLIESEGKRYMFSKFGMTIKIFFASKESQERLKEKTNPPPCPSQP